MDRHKRRKYVALVDLDGAGPEDLLPPRGSYHSAVLHKLFTLLSSVIGIIFTPLVVKYRRGWVKDRKCFIDCRVCTEPQKDDKCNRSNLAKAASNVAPFGE